MSYPAALADARGYWDSYHKCTVCGREQEYSEVDFDDVCPECQDTDEEDETVTNFVANLPTNKAGLENIRSMLIRRDENAPKEEAERIRKMLDMVDEKIAKTA